MAIFRFDSGFWLLLSGGKRIRFEAGEQTVPDEIADHWYLSVMGTRLDDSAPSENLSEVSFPDHVDTADEVYEKETLKIAAATLGITVDGRWGVDRLKAEIAAVQLAADTTSTSDAPAP